MKALKLTIYLSLLFLLGAVFWSRFKTAVVIFIEENSWFPGYGDHFFWAVVLLCLLVFFVIMLLEALRITRPGKWFYGAFMVFFCVILLSASVGGRMGGRSFGIPPDARMIEAMTSMSQYLDSVFPATGRYPIDPADLRIAKITPGYLHHGFRAPLKIVTMTDSDGPSTDLLKNSRTGIIYYWVNTERNRYWIAGLGLNGRNYGKSGFITNSEGRIVIITSPRELFRELPSQSGEKP